MHESCITTSIKDEVLSKPNISFGVLAYSLSPDAPPNLEAGYVIYLKNNTLTVTSSLIAFYGVTMVFGRIADNEITWF